MPTLLLRLAGPMQSWGTTSRFQERDTGSEPSKSGVLGLLGAALGIDRSDWVGLEPLARLRFGVRHDRPGVAKADYHSAGCQRDDRFIKADGAISSDGIVSKRQYLADAIFLAGLEGDDRALLEKAHTALRNPVWPLFLGRKAFVPSPPPWLEDGLVDEPLEDALRSYHWLDSERREGRGGEELALSLESPAAEGALRMDQPLASFAERRFGSRFVLSRTMPRPSAAVAEKP